MEESNPMTTIGEEAMRKIFASGVEKSFMPGEMVFSEGQEDYGFYLIRSGSVEIAKRTSEGQSKVIAHLKAGDFIGEAVLAGTHRKPTSAKAVTDAVLVVIPQDRFREMAHRDPETVVDFLLYALDATSRRLNNTNTTLLALFEIGNRMSQYRDDITHLSSGVIESLMAITGSEAGMVCLKNPFSETFRVVYSTDPSWTEKEFASLDLSNSQMASDSKWHLMVANMKNLGFLAMRRAAGEKPYDENQLRLLVLVAELAAFTIRDASEKAAEKAKKMLERKNFEY
jgi:CRP/FNR family transcriptional regulator, cyclic AMP receptor protein